MEGLYKHGQLNGTQLEEKFRNHQVVTPDDLTVAGVEFTVQAAKKQVNTPLSLPVLKRFLLGGLMDVSDGPLARNLGPTSPDGATKDAAADRMGEIYIAALIDEHRRRYPNCPEDLGLKLKVAFVLSTLTKAACEMANAHTDEAGIGGMIERRIKLVVTLINLGKLNSLAASGKLSVKREKQLLQTIDRGNEELIQNSFDRAHERAELIKQTNARTGYNWDNPALENPNSSAAVEARKYVAVIQIIKAMAGINMVDYLNGLDSKVRFPEPEDLIARYPYIRECLMNTQEFVKRMMSVVYENS